MGSFFCCVKSQVYLTLRSILCYYKSKVNTTLEEIMKNHKKLLLLHLNMIIIT